MILINMKKNMAICRITIKTMIAVAILCCTFAIIGTGTVFAGETLSVEDLSFTHFGMGMEALTYEESLATTAGTFSLKTTVNNFIQRSGGYTPISRKSGFIIETVSSINSGVSTDNWSLSNVGTVQTNDVRIEITEINLEGIRHYLPGHLFSGGVGIHTLNFTRSNFKLTSLNFIANPPSLSQQPLGAVSESNLSVIATAAYRYDTFFIDPERTVRMAFHAQVGLPLYYAIENTGMAQWNRSETTQLVANAVTQQQPVSLNQYFAKGINFKVAGMLGYKLNKHFTLAGFAELSYKRRPLISKNQNGQTVSVPEVTITTLRTTASIVWTF
ncbi:MAG: hypothetical protein R8L53_04345 [Mariprofundales bacterium]